MKVEKQLVGRFLLKGYHFMRFVLWCHCRCWTAGVCNWGLCLLCYVMSLMQKYFASGNAVHV